MVKMKPRRPKIRPFPKGLRIGSLVEARPNNEDELFYSAKLVGRNVADGFPYTFSVLYESDHTFESGLTRSSILVNSRRTVYKSPSLVVEDGTIVLDKTRNLVRLMHFSENVGVVQTGLLLFHAQLPNFSVLPFEYNQAFLLSFFLASSSIITTDKTTSQPRVMCLGLGGGALPSCLHFLGFSVSAMESNHEVIAVCREHFFLDSAIHVFEEDGIAFLLQTENGADIFDVIMIDLANEDNECPPNALFDALSFMGLENKMFVLNVLNTQVANALLSLKSIHVQVSCYRVGETNSVFFISNHHESCSREELLSRIRPHPQVIQAMPLVWANLQSASCQNWVSNVFQE